MTNETVMTFISLAVALLVTAALLAGNLVFAYIVDLLTGRGVPPVRFLSALGTAVGCALAVKWLAKVHDAV